MKRYLFATLLLTMLLPLGASAQWYLFPGSRHAKDSTKVERRDPFKPIGIEEETTEPDFEEFAVTKVSLILPLRSAGTPNSNFLDFYSGVLLAADNLSTSDRHYEISVFDSTLGLPAAGELEESDLIIGPVSYDDVEKILPRAHGKYIVSPLDPKVASLTDRHNIIQAPSGWEAQVDELVRWIGDDLRGGDAVVLLQSADERGGAITTRLAQKLGEAGIPYEITSTPSSKEGTVSGTCRFVIASENDDFCSAAIREVALMNIRGGRNAVYSTSKLRSLNDLEVESLHAAATRITATYYADPNDLTVKRFADKYRRLFKGDPGQWVYQGYDLMNYFGSVFNKTPDNWYAEISGAPAKGLQTDFSFDASGKTNTAVRRLRYNANNTISLVR